MQDNDVISSKEEQASMHRLLCVISFCIQNCFIPVPGLLCVSLWNVIVSSGGTFINFCFVLFHLNEVVSTFVSFLKK